MTGTAAQPQSRWFDSLGLRLHYLEWGDPAAPPVVMLHGGLDNAWSWAPFAERLMVGRRVLALDQRGHGDSDWSRGGDYHTLSFLGDLAAFIAQTAGGRAEIVSHSMGARLALFLAGAAPEMVSRVVAIEGLKRAPSEAAEPATDPRMQDWVAKRKAREASGYVDQVGHWTRARARARVTPSRPYANLDEALSRLLNGDEKRLTPEQALNFAQTNMRPAPEGGLTWKFDPLVKWHLANEAQEADRLGYFQRIACPVLHIYGERSWAYPPAPADVAAFRHARVALLPDAGHWTHLNQPELTLTAIEDFLGAPAIEPAE